MTRRNQFSEKSADNYVTKTFILIKRLFCLFIIGKEKRTKMRDKDRKKGGTFKELKKKRQRKNEPQIK